MATVALTVAGTGVGAMVGVPVGVVGVTVLILILGANIGMLSSIPAGVYGYAAGAAFGLMAQADPAVFTLTGNGSAATYGVVYGRRRSLYGIKQLKATGVW